MDGVLCKLLCAYLFHLLRKGTEHSYGKHMGRVGGWELRGRTKSLLGGGGGGGGGGGRRACR